MDIDQVRTLVHRLYSNNIDPKEIKSTQELLQTIQREPQSWQIASQLLHSESSVCQFYGALTLQVKIARDWDTLSEDNIEPLRAEILNGIVRLSTGPSFVTTKLCTALTNYAFRAVPTHWNNIIHDVLMYFREQPASSRLVLEFLKILPEELNSVESFPEKRLQLIQELKIGIPLVISILSEHILPSATSVDISLQLAALTCLKSWIQYGINLEDASPLLQHSMLLVGNPELFDEACEVLLEAMQQPKWASYISLREALLNFLTGDDMRRLCEECIKEDDGETGKTLAKLFTAFGEMFIDYVSVQLPNPQIRVLMDMIMGLTNFNGYYPVDQEVTDIPLNFWYVLQETLYDHGVIPVQDLQTLASPNNENGLTPSEQEWKYQCSKLAVELYQQLVIILKQKSTFPADDAWKSWPADVKGKFKTLRRDLGDTMINPYYVLRGDMIRILMENVNHVLHQWDSVPLPSQNVEASLFCIKSISEEVSPEEIGHIAHFFDAEILTRLQQSSSIELQRTMLLLIGSFAEWLKTAPEHLVSVLGFVVPCLHNSKLVAAAATAFTNICDTCRVQLTENVDSLLKVYQAAFQANILPTTMQKVVESVAAVIQALPLDQSIAALMSLTENILTNITGALAGAQSDPSAARDAIIRQLQNLSACCKGLQPPGDDYQSLSARNVTYDAFASGQIESLYVHTNGYSAIKTAFRKSVLDIATMWASDEAVMAALSHFLESGIRSTSPLLTLPFGDLIMLMGSRYQQHPFACWLDTARLTINAYGGHEANYEGLRNLVGVLSERTFAFIPDAQDMEAHPDVVDNYFGLLSEVIRRCPKVFYQLPENMIHYIFRWSIAGMSLQERLALKAALNFMADFMCKGDEEDTSKAAEIINANMNTIMEQLLVGIAGRVPRSFSAPLVDVLFKLTVRFTEATRKSLQQLLSQEGFPTPLIEWKDKELFMKGILGTRSLKRFKEHAHGFSVKCRGLGNTRFRTNA